MRFVPDQYVHSVALPVPLAKLPPTWESCPIVLLAPVAKEVDLNFTKLFSGALLGISLQGWLREWDADGRVSPGSLECPAQIDDAHVVFLSREDVRSGDDPERWPCGGSVLVVTEGRRGALLRSRGRWYRVPAFPSVEVDVTGAGDVFAAAFMVRYNESGNPQDAGLFASAAASLQVEKEGDNGVPDREQVEERMSLFPQRQVCLLS